MPLSSENSVVSVLSQYRTRKRSQSLTEVLERLRVSLEYSKKDWSGLMRMTEPEYQAILQGEKEASILAICELATRFQLSVDALASGNIDYGALIVHESGDPGRLPEKYSKGALSCRRTSVPVLDYLESMHGWQARNALLRSLQVRETVFSAPNERISLRFLNDSLGFLKARGYTQHELHSMGAYSLVPNQDSEAYRILSAQNSPREAYEIMIEHLMGPHFERNHRYRILKADDTHCLLDVVPSEELLTHLPVGEVTSRELCSYRAGVAASVCGYLALPLAAVTEINCIHDGAPSCQFLIDYSRATSLNSRQLRRHARRVLQ